MNTIYRLVWNSAQRTWVVAGEFASAKGKGKNMVRRSLTVTGAFMAAFLSFPAEAWVAGTGSGSTDRDGGVASNISVNGGNATGASGAIAVGSTSAATGVKSIALGEQTQAAADDSVALGSSAVANTAAGMAGYDPLTQAISLNNSAAWKSTLGALSIGDPANNFTRQITGVAAGTQDTDAVNIAQLKAGQHHYYSVNDAGLQQDNFENDGATGANALALGIHSRASADYSNAIGFGARAEGEGAFALGNGSKATGMQSTSIGNTTLASGFRSTVIGESSYALGTYSTIVGTVSEATEEDTTGVGSFVSVSGKGATAIGYGSTAKGSESAALGTHALASGARSIALGMDTSATDTNGVALGSYSVTAPQVSTANAMIEGKNYTFAGNRPIATVSIGDEDMGVTRTITNLAAGRVSATSTDAVNGSQLYATNQAISDNKTRYYSVNTNGTQLTNYNNDGAIASYSLALGPDASAQEQYSTALGYAAMAKRDTTDAGSYGSTAIGNQALAQGRVAIAMGYQAQATNRYAVALGGNAVASGERTTAVGTDATASGTSGTAIGSGSSATKFATSSVGVNSKADGMYASAFGDTAIARGEQSSAFGAAAQAMGNNSVALGVHAFVNGERAMALGRGATATRANSVALGADSVTDPIVGTAGTMVNGKTYNFAGMYPVGTVSIGSLDNERTLTNVAAGRLNGMSTDAVNGSQLFATNQAIADSTTRYYSVNTNGTTRSNFDNDGATATYSLALGPDALAQDQFSTSLGYGAAAKTNAADVTDGGSYGGTAVGYQALAQGRQAAAIGFQSQATASNTVALGGNAVASARSGTAVGAYATASGLSGTAIGLGASAAGFSSTAVGVYSTASGYFASAFGNTSRATGNQSTALGVAAQAQGDISLAAGYMAVTKGESATALGRGAQAINANDVALGSGSVTDAAVGTAGVTLDGKYYAFAGINPLSTVSVGGSGNERTITNVAAGRVSSSSTDAVNGSQLFATNQAINSVDKGSVKYDTLPDGSTDYDNITLSGETYNSVTKTGGTRIKNVAYGIDDSDAVNVQQLNDATANFYSNGVKYFHANSTKSDSVASGTESIAVGPNAQSSGDGSIAMGDEARSTGSGSVALGQGAVAKNAGDVALGAGSVTETAVATSGTTILGNKYVFAGTAPASTVSVGSQGNERTITNVAAGQINAISTDAINGSQLYATNQAIENITGSMSSMDKGSVKYEIDADGSVNYNKVIMGGDSYDNATNTGGTTIANVANGVAASDAVNKSQLDQVSQNVTHVANGTDGMFQVNNSSNLTKPKPTGKDAIAGGAGAIASADNSLSIGARSKAIHSNSVALGNDSVTDRSNSVSVGSAGSERQITHVAAGTQNTDAANVGQLKESTNNSNQYTNNKFNDLKNMVDDQKDKLSAGIAGAMAMAGLPQPYQPGASMVGLAGGTYQGESAIALGVSTISDNGKWVSKLSGTTNSRGDMGAAVGVGYQW
ncbi:YadA-like family protein [Lelliottia aquatilis]|uniref:YadA-like family protein n=1 Tax=Lelliottia aquatilis TaxID=2080838 RepID=UPI00192B6E11|nr:YadA-like family protein [Lelliottia aquatilis]MBL5886368.1 YadA-like family protein [Lelliottia aquatilis]